MASKGFSLVYVCKIVALVWVPVFAISSCASGSNGEINSVALEQDTGVEQTQELTPGVGQDAQASSDTPASSDTQAPSEQDQEIPESSNFSAETLARADSILSAWSDWVEQNDPTEASIAISYRGDLVASEGEGRRSDTPAHVASVSKAVTGVCIAKLVEAGSLSFDSSIQSVVPELVSEVTIGALLTHTSGLAQDITQEPAGYPGVDQEYLLWVSQQELSESGVGSNNSDYSYNNSNYAMLGAAISAVTGKTYEDACNELVLEPAGISSAELNSDWRIMSSWGGWNLSAVDHQKFITTYFSSDGYLGKSPLDFPNQSLNGGAFYGMGTLFRSAQGGGFNFWHHGSWHADYAGTRYRLGAFFASFNNGWAVTVNHNLSTFQYDAGELDGVLAGAVYGR